MSERGEPEPEAIPNVARTAQGAYADLALHTLGWKAFQDLCAQVCREILDRPVEIFSEAKDDGQDAAFLSKPKQASQKSGEGTVQVKYSSNPNRRLKLTDIGSEEPKIRRLVEDGRALTYVLMTNMPVDAAIASKIRQRLRSFGVQHPHVFGRHFVTLAIRGSARLRALVPRVYGLGDLSVILDERQARQTQALLGHMLPTLKVYVPTRPHLQAVRALGEHKIVLLLGDPATGKSTIAAILATIAAEDPKHRCFKADGPLQLIDNWNPDEPGGFYWIDDAFGPNQMREDYVDKWIEIMPKVQAAMASGNYFVLTSRRHIYEAAHPKLGSRNHPLFRDRQAVVEVGELQHSERRQILYNHIKAGSQRKEWKAAVKPLLEELSNEQGLLPEIARRLGDPSYTRNIKPNRDDLIKFVREPKDHLLQVIAELPRTQRAALILVFLHRGNMPVGNTDEAMQRLVMSACGVDIESIGQALRQLSRSFIVERSEGRDRFYSFKHPTLADALGAFLGDTDGMSELYLRGTRIETILSEVVCGGAAQIKDAVVIPQAQDALLVDRLLETPDTKSLNRHLFAFLDQRASDDVVRMLAERSPSLLNRSSDRSWRTVYDPKIRTHARALRLGVLSAETREQTASLLVEDVIHYVDTSFLDDDGILALLRPRQLIELIKRIKTEVLPELPDKVSTVAEEADLAVC